VETILIRSQGEILLDQANYLLSQCWQVEGASQKALVIQENGSRVYVYQDESGHVSEDFRKSLYLDYSDVCLVKKVIRLLADSPDFTIDNDFGTVLPGDQFVAKIQREEDWDWRL
jgi:hypothetical protein